MAGGVMKGQHEWMGTWQALREDLLRLEQVEPFVLVTYPDPRSAGASRPYSIALMADAEAVAADLHAKYGGNVELRVGALPYPPTFGSTAAPHREASSSSVLSPSEV